jgi:hypothetical protein
VRGLSVEQARTLEQAQILLERAARKIVKLRGCTPSIEPAVLALKLGLIAGETTALADKLTAIIEDNCRDRP